MPVWGCLWTSTDTWWVILIVDCSTDFWRIFHQHRDMNLFLQELDTGQGLFNFEWFFQQDMNRKTRNIKFVRLRQLCEAVSTSKEN